MHSLALPFPQRQAHSEQQKPAAYAYRRASLLSQCETTLLTIVARFGIHSECWGGVAKEVPHARWSQRASRARQALLGAGV